MHKEFFVFRWKHLNKYFLAGYYSINLYYIQADMSPTKSFQSEEEMIYFLPMLLNAHKDKVGDFNFLNIIVVRCTYVNKQMKIIEEIPIYWFLNEIK